MTGGVTCPFCGDTEKYWPRDMDDTRRCPSCGKIVSENKYQILEDNGVEEKPKAVMSDITSHTKNNPSNDSQFKAGQLVQLKSGGPVMTIKGSPYSKHWDDWQARSLYLIPRVGDCVNYFFNTDITCQWFVDGDLHEGSFPHTSLEPCRAETPTPSEK